jgi:hypothetical protein
MALKIDLSPSGIKTAYVSFDFSIVELLLVIITAYG